MHDLQVHIVIMAGGSGKRLWPLSRNNKPKQFISLNGKVSLLQETLNRVNNIFNPQKNYIVTAKNFENIVKDLVGSSIDKIIVEPEAKNTAPAVLFSCLNIQQAKPEDIVIFLPSDHYIKDIEKFRESLIKSALKAHNTNNIVLVGIKPSCPAIEYGYISLDKNLDVEKFHEKPDLEMAKKYLKSGNFFWNSGIICAKQQVFLDSFKQQFGSLEDFLGPMGPSISFDYAILEKSKNLSVVIADFSWSDIGTLDSFIAAKKDLSDFKNIISIDSKNNLIESKNKLLVLVGVNDLCIVDTPDVLLISQKKDLDKIKDIATKLNNLDKKEYC